METFIALEKIAAPAKQTHIHGSTKVEVIPDTECVDQDTYEVSLRDYAHVMKFKKEDIPLHAYLVEVGNLKIPSTTAIFNMSSATDCPSLKLGLCQAVKDGKNVCYAMKAERSYRPNVLPYRRRQALYWKNISAKDFASQFLLINAIKLPSKRFTALRFNEAGDFQTQSQLEKAEQIARYLKKHNVTVYCYTARRDLDFSVCRDLVINGSGFMVNGSEFRFITDIKDRPKGYAVCPMDCRICNRCQKKGSKVVVLKH